jgi:hypothetical protein
LCCTPSVMGSSSPDPSHQKLPPGKDTADPIVLVRPREFFPPLIFHHFPIKALPKNVKCRRSSALDLASRTLPRFRCRFDSDRPLHKIKHLQTLLSRRGNTKEQKQFLPLDDLINQLQIGCPLSRGLRLCVHVQRQCAACALIAAAHALLVLQASASVRSSPL